MKKALLILQLIFVFTAISGQTPKQIANEMTFAKLYGYIRYFHPSDEAAAINWDDFVLYGLQRVENCSNDQDLMSTLNSLFQPIAPSLQIADDKQNLSFNRTALIPPSLKGYKVIAWQHVGVGLIPVKAAPYQSARTNRKIVYVPTSNKSISIAKTIDIINYRGMPFMLKVKAKWLNGNGKGFFSLSVTKKDQTKGFTDNTLHHPVQAPDWQDFTLSGMIDSTADKLLFAGVMLGNGELCMNDFDLSVKMNSRWVNVYLSKFDNKKTGEATTGLLSDIPFKINADYSFNIVEDKNSPGEKWASIKSRDLNDTVVVNHAVFFKNHPQVGEYITKNIGCNLKIMMPIALYGNEQHTYPVANELKGLQLKKQLVAMKNQPVSDDSLYTHLADIVISWNVFQHFFPYFDNANTNWLQDMQVALTKAYTDRNSDEFLKTLQKFTAKLKDGHIEVYGVYSNKYSYFPSFTWEWVEKKLVITNVLSKVVELSKGDIITAINSEKPEDYFEHAEQYISAATAGWLHHRSQTETVIGEKASRLKLNLLKRDGTVTSTSVERTMSAREYYKAMPVPDSISSIDDKIMYLNMGTISMNTINKKMGQLKASKVIICDIRGNTIDNDSVNDFIGNLLSQKDTASHWLKVPEIVYPDQEKITGYQQEGFEMNLRKPHITAKILFLVDGSNISWAESYMGIIAHYKLATIIGQPTAGTNGDVNSLSLPGGYLIQFTGTKTVKLDGSAHHGVGIKPDIYVEKTIKGIRENRDEILDKAIEIANEY